MVGNGSNVREFQEDVLTLKHLPKIPLAVLRHHVDCVEGLIVQGGNDFDDVHQVGMVEFLEDHYLTQDSLGVNFIVEEPCDLLYGYLHRKSCRYLDICAFQLGFSDKPVRSLAYNLRHLVAIADFVSWEVHLHGRDRFRCFLHNKYYTRVQSNLPI